MSAPTPIRARPPIAALEGDDAYVGFVWGGAGTVRLPSGAYVPLRAETRCALAEIVLAERLGRLPAAPLRDAFCHDWLHDDASGEFVWPLAAVDEWLAAQRRERVLSPHVPQLRPIPSARGGR
jgi:hypothetical protein